MTYQVIARKWRPQTFDEVTGQEPITRTLRSAIEHERLHHAYLFSGARGVGKTTTARLLAKALNCHRSDRPTPAPCRTTDPEQCPSCQEIAEGRSIDVLEIDAASNTGIDNVREAIINTIGVRPARDRYKVFIIDEVHMLSGQAFNALLKTLEEPPPRVVFIMATTESHKVPVTILSRCQQFEFRTIAAPRIMERLRLIADAESIAVTDEALREIARAGEGSMRDAQSAFDQVISFSSGEIGTEDVETALGIASAESRKRVMRAIAGEAPAEALAVVDDLVMRGHDLRNFCRDLLAHLRDLLVVKVAGDGAGGARLTDATDAEQRELAREANAFTESDLVRFFHSLTDTERLLRESAHPRYQLEIGLVKLIEMRRLAPLGQLLERLSALEDSLRTGRAPSGGTVVPPTSTPSSASGGGGSGAPPRRQGSSSRSATEGVGAASSSSVAAAAADNNTDDTPDTGASAGMEVETADVPPFEPLPPRTVAAPSQQQPDARTKAQPAASTPTRPSAIPSLPKKFNGTTQTPSPNLKLVSPTEAVADASGTPSSSFFSEQPSGAPPSGAPSRAAASGTTDGGSASVRSSPRETAATAAAPSLERIDSRADAPSSSAGTGSSGASVESVKQALDARSKPFLAIALDGARRARFDPDELYVEFAPEGRHLRDALAKPENVRILREVCRELAGRDMGVHIVVKAAGEDDDVPVTKQDEAQMERQRLREMAEQHPAVQQLLKTFRGEIVDVRRVDAPQD